MGLGTASSRPTEWSRMFCNDMKESHGVQHVNVDLVTARALNATFHGLLRSNDKSNFSISQRLICQMTSPSKLDSILWQDAASVLPVQNFYMPDTPLPPRSQHL